MRVFNGVSSNNDCKYEKLNYLYDFVLELSRQKVIAFLGSGFSLNFSLPRWSDFVSKMIDELEKDLEINPAFYSSAGNVRSNLINIRKKVKDKSISLDFLLQELYDVVGINQFESIPENDLTKIHISNLISGVYSKEFYKKNKNDVDNFVLSRIKEKLPKVLTTNYDNLFFLDYIDDRQRVLKENNNFVISKEVEKLFLKERFYIPLHGTILDDSFENRSSIWFLNKPPNPDNINFGIIDSFGTFEKWYKTSRDEEKNLTYFFKKIIKTAYSRGQIITFFGYSFNDSYVSYCILNTLKELAQEEGFKKPFIYIFHDDFSERIISELFEDSDPESSSFSLINHDFIRQINFSQILDTYSFLFPSAELKEVKKKYDILKKRKEELEVEFDKLNIKDSLKTSLVNLNEFKNLLDYLYKKNLRWLLEILEEISKDITQNLITSMPINVPEHIKKYYAFVSKNLFLLKRINQSTETDGAFESLEDRSKRINDIYQIIITQQFGEITIDEMVNSNVDDTFLYVYAFLDIFKKWKLDQRFYDFFINKFDMKISDLKKISDFIKNNLNSIMTMNDNISGLNGILNKLNKDDDWDKDDEI